MISSGDAGVGDNGEPREAVVGLYADVNLRRVPTRLDSPQVYVDPADVMGQHAVAVKTEQALDVADLLVDYETTAQRGTVWHKFVMIERTIATGQYDWVWWLDFDTLITNTTIRVADIIEGALAGAANPDDVDYIFTNDW